MVFIFGAIATFAIYFSFCWATVFYLKPKVPRNSFLLLLILFATTFAVLSFNFCEIKTNEDFSAFYAGWILFILMGLTMWNSFYSILWGFSGGILADIKSNPGLNNSESIISSYMGQDNSQDPLAMDRMLKRRIPGLLEANYITIQDERFQLTSKGHLLACITSFLYKFYSLGKGGGIVDE